MSESNTTPDQSSREQEIFKKWFDENCNFGEDGNVYYWANQAWLARSALSGSAESGEAMDTRCPDCLGAEFPSWKRGIRCKTCNGTASVEPAPTNTTPDQGDERRASVYDAIKTMRNLGVSLNDHDSAALELLIQWGEDALSSAQPVAQPVVGQEPASMSDNGSCGSQVSGKPVSAEAGKGVEPACWIDRAELENMKQYPDCEPTVSRKSVGDSDVPLYTRPSESVAVSAAKIPMFGKTKDEILKQADQLGMDLS